MQQYIKKTNGQIIDLGDNTITYDDLERTITSLCSEENIEEIVITKAAIGDEGALFLANVIRGNKHLTNVSVSTPHNFLSGDDNRITFNGMKVLALALRMNKNVTHLNLSDNNIGDAGAKHVAYMLEASGVTSLNLDYNEITAVGMKHIADTLQNNDVLEILSLQGNRATSQGAYHLGEALKLNTHLLDLNLAQNALLGQGAEHLALALHTNNTLRALVLSSNNIGMVGLFLIDRMLRINNHIRHIDLSSNYMGVNSDSTLFQQTVNGFSALLNSGPSDLYVFLSENRLTQAQIALFSADVRARSRLLLAPTAAPITRRMTAAQNNAAAANADDPFERHKARGGKINLLRI